MSRGTKGRRAYGRSYRKKRRARELVRADRAGIAGKKWGKKDLKERK
jgi:hypothetical protein